jgi:hypothetical protein
LAFVEKERFNAGAKLENKGRERPENVGLVK